MYALSKPDMEASDSTVSTWVLGELVSTVERAGIPRAEFLAAARLDTSWLRTPDLRLQRSELIRACGVAVELTKDPAFTLHWSQWLAVNGFDVVAHLLVHASTLREALGALFRFARLVTDDLGVELLEAHGQAQLRCTAQEAEPRAQRLVAEALTLGLLHLVQHFCGRDASQVDVCFAYPPPSYHAEYTRVFEGRARFRQRNTGLVFPRSFLDAPSRCQDLELYATLANLAERRLLRLHAREPYSLRVTSLLQQTRVPHRLSMPRAARSLGLSERSLRRRLREEGQTFLQLVYRVSAERAEHLLIDKQQTIQETAHHMGFSNPASFHRAFRRWTGRTPAAFCAGQFDAGARDLTKRSHPRSSRML